MRLALALLAFLLATPAAAISYVSAERHVYARFVGIAPPTDPFGFPYVVERTSTELGSPDFFDPSKLRWRNGAFQPAPSGYFEQNPSASLVSLLSQDWLYLDVENLIGGSAGSFAGPALPQLAGGSVRITFTLDEPIRANLTASGSAGRADPVVGTSIAVAFDGPGGSILDFATTDAALYASHPPDPPFFQEQMHFAGILGPGTYTLSVSLHSDSLGTVRSSSNFAFADLRFSAVPEPGTALLLGAGLLGLGARRRQK